MKPCCGNCHHAVLDATGATCILVPPTPIMTGTVKHPVTGKPEPVIQSFFPRLGKEYLCHQHEPYVPSNQPKEI